MNLGYDLNFAAGMNYNLEYLLYLVKVHAKLSLYAPVYLNFVPLL